ncbi:MAG: flavodoxin, partial [Candidatus Aenigmarchaeota archaeon]|nr:flavodoxin [Candidatus Aenigmarchaeota archaeon]
MPKKFEVLYYSKTGNTRKVAGVIANKLGVIPESVKDQLIIKKGTFVFLGCAMYAGKLPKQMTDFIGKNNFRGREVALFGTSGAGDGKHLEEIERLLKEKGAKIKGKYGCRGGFLIFGYGHPNDDELMEA